MAQTVKNPPVMQETQETQVWDLGHQDPLEKEITTHSSIVAWEILWTEEPGGPHSMGSQRVDTAEQITLSLFLLLQKGGNTETQT